jgi:hypothetical protein
MIAEASHIPDIAGSAGGEGDIIRDIARSDDHRLGTRGGSVSEAARYVAIGVCFVQDCARDEQ